MNKFTNKRIHISTNIHYKPSTIITLIAEVLRFCLLRGGLEAKSLLRWWGRHFDHSSDGVTEQKNSSKSFQKRKSFSFLIVPMLRSRMLGLYAGIVFTFLFLVFPFQAFAALPDIDHQIVVTASIGEPRLTLFGYTSPFAKVSLHGGTSLFAEKMANSKGFFIFENLFVLAKVGDYCLYSQDREQRVSKPVCLPPLPEGNFITSVGPVLMPPTLSLSKGRFLPGDQVTASGETIPNTETAIALFKEEKQPLFVRRIYAASLPKYEVLADKNGHFSFNLPSNSTNTYRLFANSYWQEKESPKSNTLTFKVLSLWEWLLEKIKMTFKAGSGLIQPSNLGLIIFSQCLLILLLLKRKCSTTSNQPIREG